MRASQGNWRRGIFRTGAWLLSSLLLTTLLYAQTGRGPGGETSALIVGTVDSLVLDNAADIYSSGTMIVGGTEIVLPANLLIDEPANRLTLQQIFAQAPPACAALGVSGLASADVCDGAAASIATIHANKIADGRTVAGEVLIEKGQESIAGVVSFVDYTDGFLRINGTLGDPLSGTMIRINDPTGRHTVQQGLGCRVGSTNCSADERFGLDFDNYTITFSTGYPACIPSTVVGGNRTAGSDAFGVGDPLCPDTNRGPVQVGDSTRFAPILLGDHLVADGNFETINGTTFLSAHTLGVSVGLTTAPGQPDYMIFDEVEWDVAGFQNQRVRTLMIGFSTLPAPNIDVYALHVNPVDNSNTEHIVATSASNPDVLNQGIPPNAAGIFKIRFDFDFITGVGTKLSACVNLINDFGSGVGSPCEGGATPGNEFAILSPVPREIVARTRESVALATGPNPPVVLDMSGNVTTYGQYLTPNGINYPEFVEIDLQGLMTPFTFAGEPWNMDRRLGPGGCIDTTGDGVPDCEATPQPLDPFPFSGFDPRTEVNALIGQGVDPNRIFAFFPFGPNDFLLWPPGSGTGGPPPPPPPPPAPDDVLSITRARYRASKESLRVDGDVTAGGASLPATVDVYAPGTDDGLGGCSGTLVATTAVVTVTPTTGTFSYRSGDGVFAIDPVTVCAVSPNGGSAEANTTP